MSRVAASLLAIALAALIPACAGRAPRVEPSVPGQPPPAVVSPPAVVPPPAKAYLETGTASWYGRDFHGRTTASGDPFDMYGISAAHRTLPLGTVLRVTNLDNFKTILVKVNDRGPFVRGRILDLSYGAARELDAVPQGSVHVKIEAVEMHEQAAVYTVQAAAFAELENAKTLRERLQRKYETVSIVPFETNVGKFYRVRVGSYPAEEKAERIAGKLTLDGLEPVVVRKD